MPLPLRTNGRVPTREDLTSHALRQVAGAALVVLAAALVHSSGHADQKWQYVAIAAALGPQAVVDVLAIADHRRRAALRTTQGPRAVLLVPGIVLLVVAAGSWLSGGSSIPALAGFAAAAGLLVAAAPVTVSISSRSAA